MVFPVPRNETERLQALDEYQILDTPPEKIFDSITRLLATQFDAPISLVSLVDQKRQWFKSRYGLGADQTPRDIAFCAHAIMGNEIMVVEDATKDIRFANNPLVAGAPGIRFYAGAPLLTAEGYSLGTLNVIDFKPRTLTQPQYGMLEEMAGLVVEILDLRRAAGAVVTSERTAAKNAERLTLDKAQELQASEERFQDITSNVPGVVYQFRIDADGRPSFPYVSDTIRDLLGLEPGAVARDPDTWFSVIHSDDRPGLDESIAESLVSLAPWFWEGRMTRSTGDEGWFRGSSTPRKLDDGSVLWNGFVIDITALKQAEERLRQAQKMEAVGQLTGGVAHDFNNLLAVITGNLELLGDRLEGGNAEVAAISRAVSRGAELTQRLLAFSRQQPLRPRPVDLSALVSTMSDLLARTIGETIEIETFAAPDLWEAQADSGQVENALLNLVLNARDAMPDGGKLTIECRNVRLDDTVSDEDSEIAVGDYVVLAVSDNGIGMSAEVKAQAFEPFYTTKEVGQGSGLGLSMVYGFAKQSGGHVSIYSEVNQGTTVNLYLPRSAPGTLVKAKRGVEELPLGKGETILVVEDDDDVRDLAVKMVGNLGYRVIAVADAAAADDVLAGGEAVDLVLSDVVLPGGTSGPEFAERARKRFHGLRVIFMSGYPAEAAKRNGFVGSDNVLLNKPFQRHQLAVALRDALD